VNIGYQERILIVNETLHPALPAEAATVPTEAVMEFRQLPFAEATEKIFSEVTEGKFDLVPQYAVAHLGSGILMAMVGLGVLFVGYLFAKYVSRLVSTPICRRVDETLGRFSGRVVFYGIMFGVAGAVLSKMGRGRFCNWFGVPRNIIKFCRRRFDVGVSPFQSRRFNQCRRSLG
jgi:hypothetical protein